MEILVPESSLETAEDRFGFLLFVKALHFMLRMDEGICIEHDGKKYLVHKFKNEETNEELVGIQFDPIFGEYEDKIKSGTMVWCDLDKPLEERHGDYE